MNQTLLHRGLSSNFDPLLPQQRIPFTLSTHSSQQDNSATALEEYNPRGQGWKSARFDEFPHLLGFELQTPLPPSSSTSYTQDELDNDEINVFSIQILSHQAFISQRIEIFAGKERDANGDSTCFETATFEFVGDINFQQRPIMSSREVQTLSPLNIKRCKYLLFRIHGPYAHPDNLFGQVGIIAVSVSGTSRAYAKQLETTIPGYQQVAKSRRADRQDLMKRSNAFKQELNQTLVSVETSLGMVGMAIHDVWDKTGNKNKMTSVPDVNDISFEITYDQWTAKLLRIINNAKMHYVGLEEFTLADEVKQAELGIRETHAPQVSHYCYARRVLMHEENYEEVEIVDEMLRRSKLYALRDIINAPAFLQYCETVLTDRGKVIWEMGGETDPSDILKEASRAVHQDSKEAKTKSMARRHLHRLRKKRARAEELKQRASIQAMYAKKLTMAQLNLRVDDVVVFQRSKKAQKCKILSIKYSDKNKEKVEGYLVLLLNKNKEKFTLPKFLRPEGWDKAKQKEIDRIHHSDSSSDSEEYVEEEDSDSDVDERKMEAFAGMALSNEAKRRRNNRFGGLNGGVEGLKDVETWASDEKTTPQRPNKGRESPRRESKGRQLKNLELRIDGTDGKAYSKIEFKQKYKGNLKQWHHAERKNENENGNEKESENENENETKIEKAKQRDGDKKGEGKKKDNNGEEDESNESKTEKAKKREGGKKKKGKKKENNRKSDESKTEKAKRREGGKKKEGKKKEKISENSDESKTEKAKKRDGDKKGEGKKIEKISENSKKKSKYTEEEEAEFEKDRQALKAAYEAIDTNKEKGKVTSTQILVAVANPMSKFNRLIKRRKNINMTAGSLKIKFAKAKFIVMQGYITEVQFANMFMPDGEKLFEEALADSHSTTEAIDDKIKKRLSTKPKFLRNKF